MTPGSGVNMLRGSKLYGPVVPVLQKIQGLGARKWGVPPLELAAAGVERAGGTVESSLAPAPARALTPGPQTSALALRPSHTPNPSSPAPARALIPHTPQPSAPALNPHSKPLGPTPLILLCAPICSLSPCGALLPLWSKDPRDGDIA
uniref:Uncharacterized protein n=1 Tax=Terrapene triunguis TaxID=2587831 RepID=A0A674J5D2_9SAUR